MIAGGFRIGIDRDQPADRGDGGLGLGVVLVGVVLVVGANALADNHGDLVVIGGMNTDRAVSVDDLQAGARREILLEMVVEVVVLRRRYRRSRCRRS